MRGHVSGLPSRREKCGWRWASASTELLASAAFAVSREPRCHRLASQWLVLGLTTWTLRVIGWDMERFAIVGYRIEAWFTDQQGSLECVTLSGFPYFPDDAEVETWATIVGPAPNEWLAELGFTYDSSQR